MGFINTDLFDCRNRFSENEWGPKDTFVNPLKLPQFIILKKADEKHGTLRTRHKKLTSMDKKPLERWLGSIIKVRQQLAPCVKFNFLPSSFLVLVLLPFELQPIIKGKALQEKRKTKVIFVISLMIPKVWVYAR